MSGAPYAKPFLSIAQQRLLLQSRGLTVSDAPAFETALRSIGYYRLSAYTHTFRRVVPGTRGSGVVRHESFIEGTTAEQVLALYEFDRRLKLLALDAIERIEIALRFDVAHTLGRRDPFGHLEKASLDRRFVEASGASGASGYQRWREGFDATQRRAKEPFVDHFATAYDGRMPIWVAVEILSFRQLSVLYQGLKPAMRYEIAQTHHLPDPKVLASWLHSLTYLRNVCAHHARLWNRNVVVQPGLPNQLAVPMLGHLREGSPRPTSRAYGLFAISQYLLRGIDRDAEWAHALREHIATLPVGGPVGAAVMGFPPGWTSHPLWEGRWRP